MKYDYLIVGSGLFGAVFARKALNAGKTCLVVEKRSHIGGNVYTEEVDGVIVHKYGAHIFHTSDEQVWSFITEYAEFNDYINSPIADYHGERYHLPFNMNTFHEMWGVNTAEEARKIIDEQVSKANIKEPKNLEEQAISMVGEDVYRKLVKEYTEQQWGRDCKDLPPFIIKRLPVRFTYDNNYFNDKYQGIPIGGYTKIVEKLLVGADVKTNCDYFDNKDYYDSLAEKIVYSGPIDRLFDFSLGKLEYRTVRFETETLNIPDYQGNAVVNYTSHEVPYTRIIEHKHFEFGTQPKTVISKEYSKTFEEGDEPYYPVNDEKNEALADSYVQMAKDSGYIIGGRLADYKYYNMDVVVKRALDLAKNVI